VSVTEKAGAIIYHYYNLSSIAFVESALMQALSAKQKHRKQKQKTSKSHVT